ncbi:hypothetical protein HDV03_003225 [Kappamyces sp. JEL0829]|nr:hypothetical protein HDV03_003225 [Kappamyces sp. JEL0829]
MPPPFWESVRKWKEIGAQEWETCVDQFDASPLSKTSVDGMLHVLCLLQKQSAASSSRLSSSHSSKGKRAERVLASCCAQLPKSFHLWGDVLPLIKKAIHLDCAIAISVWWPSLLGCLLSEQESGANSPALLELLQDPFAGKDPQEYKNETDELLPLLPCFVDSVEQKSLTDQDQEWTLRAWSLLLVVFHSHLHRTTHLNKLLAITQSCFNSKRNALRLSAFRAWKTLVWNFTFNNQLEHGPKMDLLLIPIMNALAHETVESVRTACQDSFFYLLAVVSQRRYPDIWSRVLGLLLSDHILHEKSWKLYLPIVATFATQRKEPAKEDPALKYLLLDAPSPVLLASIQKTTFPASLDDQDFTTMLSFVQVFSQFQSMAMEDVSQLQQVARSPKAIPAADRALPDILAIWSTLIKSISSHWSKDSAQGFFQTTALLNYLQNHHSGKMFGYFAIAVCQEMEPPADAPLGRIGVLLANRLETLSQLVATSSQTHLKLKWFVQSLNEKMKPKLVDPLLYGRTPKPKEKDSSLVTSPTPQSQGLAKNPPTPSPQATPFAAQSLSTKKNMIKVPPSTAKKPGTLTEHQLERMNSQSKRTLKALYNNLISTSQPDILSSPRKRLKGTTSELLDAENQAPPSESGSLQARQSPGQPTSPQTTFIPYSGT